MRHPHDRHARLMVKINTDPKIPSNENMYIGTSKFIDHTAVFDHLPAESGGVSPCHSRMKGTSAKTRGTAESTIFSSGFVEGAGNFCE